MSSLRRFYILAVGIIASVVLVGIPAIAQDATQDELGSGLNVTPTRYERTIQPGATDSIEFTVKNPTTARVIVSPVVNDFIDDNGTGYPQIITDDSRDDLPSIRPFLNELESFPIDPDETVTVTVPIEVPEGTAAGGYYGVVRFRASPDGVINPDDGQVALNANVAPIVLITVPGDITEQVQFRNLLFYRKDVAGTFFTQKPEQIGVQLLNQGNGFVKPFGTVRVTNPLGKEVINYSVNSATPPSNLLPNSKRTFLTIPQNVDVSNSVSLPGRYQATAELSFGNGGEILTMKKAFWYLPYWFVAVLLVLIAGLVYAGFAVRRKVITGSYKKRK